MAGARGGSQAALARVLGLEVELVLLCAGGLSVARGNGFHLPLAGPAQLAVLWLQALGALSGIVPRF